MCRYNNAKQARSIIFLLLLALAPLLLTGCSLAAQEVSYMDLINKLLAENNLEVKDLEGGNASKLDFTLTYPAGRSPKVFTKGWVFGARCIVNKGTKSQKDLSEEIEWTGSATFSPAKGRLSRPSFEGEGANTITLSCVVNGKKISKTFKVQAVSPEGHAYVGMQAKCPSDAHGCPACPHATMGPIISGSPNVFINGKRAARVGDTGIHAACCGPNTFAIKSSDSDVIINGRRAAMVGSKTSHCGGGEGRIVIQ